MPDHESKPTNHGPPHLDRSLGLLQATALNVANMIGIGPFITIPLFLAGLAHFDASLLRMPKDAFQLDWTFALGLGAAMRIAVYDYLGYYNICHLGDEVRDPGRTIPRAVIISVLS